MSRRKLRLGFGDKIETVSVDVPQGEPKPWDADAELKIVGKKVPRVDGAMRVSGEATYTHDVREEGMLYAAVLRSPHPCAVLKSLDVEKARRLPGVHGVLALAEPKARLLFAGQDVAAVAAERPDVARDALDAIVAEYEPQDFEVSTSAAMRPGSPVVHKGMIEERRTGGDEHEGAGSASKQRGNVRPGRSQKKGDAKKGLRRAKKVFEATYRTQCHTHSALETHGLVVRWDGDDAMTVWASTQSIFSVRDEMAEMFDLKPEKVHVITRFIGGGFGAKFGANAPGSALGKIAGDLAKQTGRPVHLMLNREDEHLCTGNRPDSIQKVRLGADAKGKLVAIHVTAHGSAGIGTGAGVGRNAFGIYTKCPNILVESADVFTHAGPATAFRAPGHPQGAFAIESALDELARDLELDPIDLRLRHDEHPVRRHQLELGRERFDWTKKRAEAKRRRTGGARVRRGVGVAASIWGDYGRPGAVATVSVSREGTVIVRNGIQDIGTGIATVIGMVTAEVLHLPVERVRVEIGDSEFGQGTGSGGSKTTATIAPAVRNAAENARAQLEALALEAFDVKDASKLRWDDRGGVSFGRKSLSFEQLCAKMSADAIVATGQRAKTFHHGPMKYPGSDLSQIAGVQFAEVSVDTWTGVVRCERVLAVHDCGRVMNELTLRSQINGGIILGAGYALMEQRVMDIDLGVMLNPNLENYKILGAQDTPDIDILLTEVYAGNNSAGAIGIGEPATIPTAAAIANAVGDALGVHVRRLPLTPARVLDTLERQALAKSGEVPS